MRISVQYALALLTLAIFAPLLAGCDHKAQTAQTQPLAPPIVDAPPPKPAPVSPADLPPPVIGEPKPATTDKTPSTKPAETPKKPVHHPKKPAATPPAETSAPAQEAANVPPSPGVSAVGTLSTGSSGDLRTETQDTIAATEKGVNAITRTLSDSEAKTAAQIHEFLKQARDALTSGDVDGAHTLAIKAKVLLTELNQ
jgi:outer membrane biosynthesis protein TonB